MFEATCESFNTLAYLLAFLGGAIVMFIFLLALAAMDVDPDDY